MQYFKSILIGALFLGGTVFALGLTSTPNVPVDTSSLAPASATYITQTASTGLSAEQALGALTTGLLKSTTTTGVVSIAADGTDYLAPSRIDDTKGNGDTTYIWSADKVFDQLALKAPLASPTFTGTVTIPTLSLTGTAEGNITIKKADPSLVFDVTTDTDTDYSVGVNDDAGGDDDDVFEIREGSTAGSNVRISIDTTGNVNIPILTASELIGTDASKNLVSLPVATYPSPLELSYVKGVTSAIQTQIGTKAPTASPTFTGIAAVGNGTTSAGVFQIDEDDDDGSNKVTMTTLPLAADVTVNWDDTTDNYVLTFDDATKTWAGEAAGGGITTSTVVNAYRSSNLAIDNAYENVIYDTEATDTNSEYNNTTGVFTANGNGLRIFEFTNSISRDNSVSFLWHIELDGTDVIGGKMYGIAGSGADTLNIPYTIYLTNGQTVELEMNGEAASGVNVIGGATEELRSRLRVTKIQ